MTRTRRPRRPRQAPAASQRWAAAAAARQAEHLRLISCPPPISSSCQTSCWDASCSLRSSSTGGELGILAWLSASCTVSELPAAALHSLPHSRFQKATLPLRLPQIISARTCTRPPLSALCRNAPGTLMLVCKQWQRVYLSCAALHSKLVLSLPIMHSSDEQGDSWLVSTGQRLQRVGRLCCTLSIQFPGHRGESHPACLAQLPDVLGGVQPAHLTSLRAGLWSSMPDRVPGWLGGMSRLAALGLASRTIQPEVAAAIGGLTQLQRLWIGSYPGSAPPGLLDSLLRLRQLVKLALLADGLPSLAPLTRLDRLQMLKVTLMATADPFFAEEAQPLIVPPPAAFPSLQFELFSTSRPTLLEVR